MGETVDKILNRQNRGNPRFCAMQQRSNWNFYVTRSGAKEKPPRGVPRGG